MKNRQADENDYDESENEDEKHEKDSSEDEETNDFQIKKEILSDDEGEDHIYPKKKKPIQDNEDIEQLENIEKKEEMKDEMTANDQIVLDELTKKNSMATGFLQDNDGYKWCKIKFEVT